jgi:hypothetical protein
LRRGFYGIGDGTPGGTRLAERLAVLLADPGLRASLGGFGREAIVSRYSLRAAAARLVSIYEHAIAERPSQRALLPEAARSAWLAAGVELHNHLPSNKRARAESERRKLAAASAPIGSPATEQLLSGLGKRSACLTVSSPAS